MVVLLGKQKTKITSILPLPLNLKIN
ncbi:hypothetical protein CY0110_17347 [Crocosphaera chwakensis CCY0110]|uniref:Uncharacterized protein n=1 Tax=Crocosphaera chwakensis CCY0110 TaxID=391612 RepID=A3IIF1_9CHRO|nr:hypothetical protein CY0110_17347 [Crocosphaera chwakensis CCY0110]